MSVHITCRTCGGERNDKDMGYALCKICRDRTTLVTSHEVQAAFAACVRDAGGKTPRVAWISEKAPQRLWLRRPKENGTKVLIVPLVDE